MLYLIINGAIYFAPLQTFEAFVFLAGSAMRCMRLNKRYEIKHLIGSVENGHILWFRAFILLYFCTFILLGYYELLRVGPDFSSHICKCRKYESCFWYILIHFECATCTYWNFWFKIWREQYVFNGFNIIQTNFYIYILHRHDVSWLRLWRKGYETS